MTVNKLAQALRRLKEAAGRAAEALRDFGDTLGGGPPGPVPA